MQQAIPTTDEEFRIGVHRKVYNATLRDAITRTGKNVATVASEIGVSYATLLDWIRFKTYPRDNEVRLRVAIYFGIPDDVLFPEEIAHVRLKKQPEDLRLTYSEFEEAAKSWLLREQPTVEALAEAAALQDAVSLALQHCLTAREARVIRERFGLDGVEPKTLQDVAKIWGVSAARIRQLETKAFKKLRTPGLRNQLWSFLTWCDGDTGGVPREGRVFPPKASVAETLRFLETGAR